MIVAITDACVRPLMRLISFNSTTFRQIVGDMPVSAHSCIFDYRGLSRLYRTFIVDFPCPSVISTPCYCELKARHMDQHRLPRNNYISPSNQSEVHRGDRPKIVVSIK